MSTVLSLLPCFTTTGYSSSGSSMNGGLPEIMESYCNVVSIILQNSHQAYYNYYYYSKLLA